MEYAGVKDSGKREEMVTGSVRDTREGKGRYDLIPPYPMKRLAQHYENGAVKYGDRNWEKGQKLMRFLDSAMRHLQCVIAGENDEDHESAVIWNVMGYMDTKQRIAEGKLPKSLDDRPDRPETEKERLNREYFNHNRLDAPRFKWIDEIEAKTSPFTCDVCDYTEVDDDEEYDDKFAEENLPSPEELFSKLFKDVRSRLAQNEIKGIDSNIVDLTDRDKRKVLKIVLKRDTDGIIFMIADRDSNQVYYLNLTQKGIGAEEKHSFPYEEREHLYFIFHDENIVGMAGSDEKVDVDEYNNDIAKFGTKLVEFIQTPKGKS